MYQNSNKFYLVMQLYQITLEYLSLDFVILEWNVAKRDIIKKNKLIITAFDNVSDISFIFGTKNN